VGKGLRRIAIAVMNEVSRHHPAKNTVLKKHFSNHQKTNLLVQYGLPFTVTFWHWKIVYFHSRPRPQFSHHVLYVEDERFLSKICVYHLSRSLKTHRWVQIRLLSLHTKLQTTAESI
jgi:hypothetical protein